MSPSRPLQLGSVVWAELEDPNGYRKVRPGVVVTPTADINADFRGGVTRLIRTQFCRWRGRFSVVFPASAICGAVDVHTPKANVQYTTLDGKPPEISQKSPSNEYHTEHFT